MRKRKILRIARDGGTTVFADSTAGLWAPMVYATDSRAPVLYRVPEAGDTLERFLSSPLLLSGQGLATAPDGRTLYLSDYARGIIQVDLPTRRAALLAAEDTVLALGIDGLAWTRAGLIGVQNGVTPHRVVRLTLDQAGNRVVRSEVLDRAHPAYDEPTLGVLVGDEFYYVADGQWERFGPDGAVADSSALRSTVVLRLRL